MKKPNKTKKNKKNSLSAKTKLKSEKEIKILKPDSMTKGLMIQKEVEEVNKSVKLPLKIKASHNFQVLNYKLKVRDRNVVHLAGDLPAQHYISTQKALREFLSNDSPTYKTCFCPIYFITCADSNFSKGAPNPPYTDERIVYVGQTNTTDSRFREGHSATQKLNEYEFYNKLKMVFMTQIYIDFIIQENGEVIEHKDIALEWLEFEDVLVVPAIISFVEYYIIFGITPKFNTVGTPLYHSDDYLLKAPKALRIDNLVPHTIKVVNDIECPNYGDLLRNYNVTETILNRSDMVRESRKFFEKYGILPKTLTE